MLFIRGTPKICRLEDVYVRISSVNVCALRRRNLSHIQVSANTSEYDENVHALLCSKVFANICIHEVNSSHATIVQFMMMKKILGLLRKVDWVKTLYFNFKYFPLKVAFRLPFLIYHRTDLYKMGGKITFKIPPKLGLVKIGPHSLGTQDIKYSRTMWEVSGTLVVCGKASIGRGSRISIGNDAVLELGDNFSITGRSSIISQKEITFGNNCLLSWDILIMDTDFHHILNDSNEIINHPRPIHIGNHVWIGCRNTILKGVSIADNVIVSANSTLTKSVVENNCAVGGSGKDATILKRNINWKA